MKNRSIIHRITSLVLCYCLILWQLQPSIVYAAGESVSETSDSNAALENIGTLNLFSEKGGKLLATDAQRKKSQQLKAEAMKLFYEACKAQLMTKQKENIGALKSLTSNLVDATATVNATTSGLDTTASGLDPAASEATSTVRATSDARKARIAGLREECRTKNCCCSTCEGRGDESVCRDPFGNNINPNRAYCNNTVCKDYAYEKSEQARIRTMEQKAKDFQAGTSSAQNSAQDAVVGTTDVMNSTNLTREATFQAVQAMIVETNERAETAISLAKQARVKAMEAIGAVHSDYKLTHAMMEDIRIAGRGNAEQTGVMASAAFDLCCQDISDVRCVSYHLYTAAASIYVASQILDASDYGSASKEIMATDIDPNQEMNDQVENLKKAQLLRQEIVKSAETLQQGKDSITQMMTYVRMVAEQEIETAEARQDNAEAASQNANQMMQMLQMALSMAQMISKLDVVKEMMLNTTEQAKKGVVQASCICGCPPVMVPTCEADNAKSNATKAKQAAKKASTSATSSTLMSKTAELTGKATDAIGKAASTAAGKVGELAGQSFVSTASQAAQLGGMAMQGMQMLQGGGGGEASDDSGGGAAADDAVEALDNTTKNEVLLSDELPYKAPVKKRWNPDLSYLPSPKAPMTPMFDYKKPSFLSGVCNDTVDVLSDFIIGPTAKACGCSCTCVAPCAAANSAASAASAQTNIQDALSVLSIAMMAFQLLQMLKGMKGKEQAHEEQLAANIHGHMKCGETKAGAGLTCPLSVLNSTDNLLDTIEPTEQTSKYGSAPDGNTTTFFDPVDRKSIEDIESEFQKQITAFEKKWGDDLFMMDLLVQVGLREKNKGFGEYLKVLDLSRLINGAVSSLPHNYNVLESVKNKASFLAGRVTDLLASKSYAARTSSESEALKTVAELEKSLGVMEGSKAFEFYQQHRSTATTLSRSSFEVPESRAEYLGMVESQGQSAMDDMLDALNDSSLYDDHFEELIDNFDPNGTSMDLGDSNIDITDTDSDFDVAAGGLESVVDDTSGGGLGSVSSITEGELGGLADDSIGPGGTQNGVGGDNLVGGTPGSSMGGIGGIDGTGVGVDSRGGSGVNGTGRIGGMNGSQGAGSGQGGAGIGGAGGAGQRGGMGGIGGMSGSSRGVVAGGSRTNVHLGAGGSSRVGGRGRGGKGRGHSTSASARRSAQNMSKMGTINPNSPVGKQIDAIKNLIANTRKGLLGVDGNMGRISSHNDVTKRGKKILDHMNQATIDALKKAGKYKDSDDDKLASRGKKGRRGRRGRSGKSGSGSGFGSGSGISSGIGAGSGKDSSASASSSRRARGSGSGSGDGKQGYDDDGGFDFEDDGGGFGDFGDDGGGFALSKDSRGRGGIGFDETLDSLKNLKKLETPQQRYRRSLQEKLGKGGKKKKPQEINLDRQRSLFKIVSKRYRDTAYPLVYEEE
ncbi:MAG: hypothetical protein ISR65_01455 [Bacteriovoracaceae bacterium]|nr:hypothetical protein [Bacteriovoracaceae bacterium]